MALDGAIDGVNHVERAPRRAAVRHVPGSDVKRKELGCQAAFLHSLDVRPIGNGRRTSQVEIIIRHRRGDVVMSVNDDRAAMNRECSLPERFITSRTRGSCSYKWRLRRALCAGRK